MKKKTNESICIKESIRNKYPNFIIEVEITFEPLMNADIISDQGK